MLNDQCTLYRSRPESKLVELKNVRAQNVLRSLQTSIDTIDTIAQKNDQYTGSTYI